MSERLCTADSHVFPSLKEAQGKLETLGVYWCQCGQYDVDGDGVVKSNPPTNYHLEDDGLEMILYIG